MRISFSSKRPKALMAMLIGFLGISGSVAFGGEYLRHDPDISGKILDYDTRRPKEGVVVSSVWFYEPFRFSEASRREYYDYFETLTDQDGRFRIPGKGLCIIRNVSLPTISIFKAGYSILQLRNLVVHSRQDFPSGDELKWVDGEAVILFRKKSSKEIKRYLHSDPVVPLMEMMRAGVPPEKVRLYVRECKREYGEAGMTSMRPDGPPPLRYKKGGVFPAGREPVRPRSSK